MQHARSHIEKGSPPFEENGVLPLHPNREVVVCRLGTSIQEAAGVMSQRNVGSIVIVDEKRWPRGIVTDTDLRRKVVAGNLSPAAPIERIMSHPVTTVPANITSANAILQMMKNNIRHLCVTGNGTPDSEIIGVISEHDVLLLHGNNPAVLVKEIQQSGDVDQLARIRDRAEELARQYLLQGVSVRFISEIVTEINDALIGKLIPMAEARVVNDGIPHPRIRYCWLSFGSEGRREQLLRTDQDNAIVYEEPTPDARDRARKFFLRLGVEVTQDLARCGFAMCPGNNMASNPKWCQPLSVWKEYFHQWVNVPEEAALLNVAIFFDFRPVFGDYTLASSLREHITRELHADRTAIILLAKNALRNPDPLNVVGKFIVERKGQQRSQFDIKLRGMKPLTDAARVLALDLDVHSITNTVERFRKIAELDSSIGELSPDVITAYELFLRYRGVQGLEHRDSGRYIDLAALTKLEREVFRNAFEPIKAMLTLLRVRFQLDALGLR
jgi:CBS domain-containing protein